LPKFKFL
jgi:hypothetical protein